jgi:hypothetical protein
LLETVRANKVRYAQAEASARARNPDRPSFFDVPFIHGHAIMEGMSEVSVVHSVG